VIELCNFASESGFDVQEATPKVVDLFLEK
jgi:hypothetical protein